MRTFVKNAIRSSGWELRRADPQAHLDRLLAAMIRDFEISAVVDAGAHVGEFGKIIRSGRYRGRLVSFEPNPAVFDTLEMESARDELWSVRNAALGSENGTLTMNTAPSTVLSSFLETDDSASNDWEFVTKPDQTIEVDVYRLDSLLPDLVSEQELKNMFVKLHTQGWDLEVLKGATALISGITMIQIDLSFKPVYVGQPSRIQVMSFLEDLGFEMVGLYPIVRDSNWSIIEADGVFVRRDARVG